MSLYNDIVIAGHEVQSHTHITYLLQLNIHVKFGFESSTLSFFFVISRNNTCTTICTVINTTLYFVWKI